MKPFPKSLQSKLEKRKVSNALRNFGAQNNLVDFSSNDYLGFSKSEIVFKEAHQYLIDNNILQNGATGSRLLSGNHSLYAEVENMLCAFHNTEAALVFNSGYTVNIGFFSSVPQREDIILYDEYIHASIRDGIQMSNAKAYKFKHNNLEDLNDKILRQSKLRSLSEAEVSRSDMNIYIVTESVFSMDGDTPDLVEMSKLCIENNIHLIIDEAHAVGVFGKKGEGIVQELGLENEVFARIVTFGKALGCHGAAILGSKDLKQYLVNFARSFIYTTALPPHAIVTIQMAYNKLVIQNECEESRSKRNLNQNIQFFKSELVKYNLHKKFIESNSAIHCSVIPGNENVKQLATQIQNKGFDVKAILSPTVSKGQERLRFCIHSYNSNKEISKVLKVLATFVP